MRTTGRYIGFKSSWLFTNRTRNVEILREYRAQLIRFQHLCGAWITPQKYIAISDEINRVETYLKSLAHE